VIALRWAVVGAAAATVALLSPLTVWFALAIVPIVAGTTRGLDRDERRWVVGLTALAVVLRVAVVVALFLSTDHSQVPFGTFFGDEDYFIKRSLWLRNVGLGIPVHAIDLEYAFEPNGRSSYLYLLASIQTLVGAAPYGLHLVSIAFYVLAILVLYRTIRITLGRVPAFVGLAVLLFLPSLFAWSIAVLKEPLFVLINALSLALTAYLVRPASFGRRMLALVGIVVAAAVLESVRQNGAIFAAMGITLGLAIGYGAARPRVILTVVIAAPLLLGALFSRPGVQLKAYAAIQSAARQHWGAVVVSQGHGYRLLDDRFYAELNEASSMKFGETFRFLARGIASYLTVPRPWDAQSRAEVAYIPEQVIWYILAALAAIGAVCGFRRDPAVTGLLIAHALLLAAASAFTDGNVGTLVRHRGLVLPYLVWLSGVGVCELIAVFRRSEPFSPLMTVLPRRGEMRPA
jgi:hypothetical protein